MINSSKFTSEANRFPLHALLSGRRGTALSIALLLGVALCTPVAIAEPSQPPSVAKLVQQSQATSTSLAGEQPSLPAVDQTNKGDQGTGPSGDILTVCPGSWVPLAHMAPSPVELMLQLSDGTIMAADAAGSAWYRLTPDSSGSYINGTWTNLASMHDTRLYYSSQVLKDGRVFVAGGEYGSGTAKAEVYNPLTNVWTQTNPPTSLLDPSQPWPGNPAYNQGFADSNSEILANGNVLIAPVLYKTAGQPLIYNPVANTWAAGPNYVRGVYQDESSWVKLPDNSILTVDPFGVNSERYIPATNTWVNDSNLPVSLYDPIASEMGAGFLLPNGKAFYLGATGHTALYTPTGTVAPGTWVAGPDIPGGLATPDAPAAMMVNGHVLCAVSPKVFCCDGGGHNVFPGPTTFYEYDYTTNSFTSVSAPTGATEPGAPYYSCMLVLPDGNVMYAHADTQLYIYQPGCSPLPAGKPVISSISPTTATSFLLTGTGLNGISEGAAYGDDNQMASNYPLVRLTAGGTVYYARTHDWSSTGVMTGATVVTTQFDLPAGLPCGSYSLVVVANGIASDPVAFTPPADSCGCAQPIGVGTFNGSTVGMTNDGSNSCGFNSATTPDIWYSYTAPCSGILSVDTEGSSFDTVLSIHSGCPGTAANELACNDDCVPGSDLRSCLTLSVNAGSTYLIRVSGYNGLTGTTVLNVHQSPPNDNCAAATPIGNGTFAFGNCFATTDGPNEPNACNFFNYTQIDADIWFRYSCPCTGTVRASLCGSAYDTKMAVYGAACPLVPGTAFACNDDFCGLQSYVTFSGGAGSQYLIRIGGYNGLTGNGTLTIYCCSAPPDGDMNLDGVKNGRDIQHFCQAVVANSIDPSDVCHGDFSGDQVVDLADVPGMVAKLLGP